MTRYIPGRFDLPRGSVMWVWPTPYGPMESKPAPKTPLRIGDAERDRAIADLGDHFAAGRLNTEEFEQRVDQAIRARFNDDLEPLFVDLPRTAEPSVESRSNHRSGCPPRLVTRGLVRAAAGGLRGGCAVILSAPWLVWMFLWVFLDHRVSSGTAARTSPLPDRPHGSSWTTAAVTLRAQTSSGTSAGISGLLHPIVFDGLVKVQGRAKLASVGRPGNTIRRRPDPEIDVTPDEPNRQHLSRYRDTVYSAGCRNHPFAHHLLRPILAPPPDGSVLPAVSSARVIWLSTSAPT